MPGAAEVIADPAIDEVAVTDTIPPFRLDRPAENKKLVVLPAAPLLADAIRRLRGDRSLSDLLVF